MRPIVDIPGRTTVGAARFWREPASTTALPPTLRTPTVPLRTEDPDSTIWCKLEYLQPSGSTKDRIAHQILMRGIQSGRVTSRTVVVEASSGSTSIAFAMASAALGLRFVAVMPADVSPERTLIIRRLGAEVQLTPVAGGLAAALQRTEELAAGDPDVLLPRQFENPLNPEAHERGTAQELLDDVPVRLDGFAAGVGTGGTLLGIGRALRCAWPGVRLARAVPAEASGLHPETCSVVPGVVDGFSKLLVPSAIDLEDDVLVTVEELLGTTRELVGAGFPVGPSSGLNVAAAHRLARRIGPGAQVATVLCDRMERYFSTPMFADLRASTGRSS